MVTHIELTEYYIERDLARYHPEARQLYLSLREQMDPISRKIKATDRVAARLQLLIAMENKDKGNWSIVPFIVRRALQDSITLNFIPGHYCEEWDSDFVRDSDPEAQVCLCRGIPA